ncbi:MAG: DUF2079 domain-containing protein [Acidimicrobiales bacterium]
MVEASSLVTGVAASSSATSRAAVGPQHIGLRVVRRVWWAAAVLGVVQGGALLAWSWHLWSHFDLSSDFATYAQAWSQIGTGHLDPYDTLFLWHAPHYGYPFLQSHFELAVWPLAMLRSVGLPVSALLVVQDVALVVATGAAVRLVLEVVDRHWPRQGDRPRRGVGVVAGCLAAACVACPWIYWAASFDFHLQVVATALALLAARDALVGRRRAWVYAGAVLLCGDVAATYLVAVGLATLVAGRRRLDGIGFVVAATAWLGVVALFHADKGSSLAAGYGYLTGHAVGSGLAGIVAIVAGMVRHPQVPARVLRDRWRAVGQYLVGSGLIGVRAPLGLAAAVVVLVPNALNASGIYVSHVAGFQNLFPALALASASAGAVTWIARRRPGALARSAAVALAGGALVATCAVTVQTLPTIGAQFETVPGPTAARLGAVAAVTPPSAEVVATNAVVGRFATRRWVYPFLGDVPDQVVPVFGRTVVVVLVTHLRGAPRSFEQLTTAARHALSAMGAHLLVHGAGVTAFRFERPHGMRSIVLP